MARLETEEMMGRFEAVETWPDETVLLAIADGQSAAATATRQAIPALSAAAVLMTGVWRNGGRIAYAGAGSSGLIAAADALELPGTYGLEPERLPIILAGGAASFLNLDYGSEDDSSAAAAAVKDACIRQDDLMIAVSASGSTPFTLGAATAAKAVGAKLIAIACNRSAPLLDLADVAIAVVAGPEIVAGSTRMNAGTAQKCALNMLSTLMAMRLHLVHRGMMVNLHAGNEKLRRRAVSIVARAADVEELAARRALETAGGEVKAAILVAMGLDPETARSVLKQANGDLRAAIEYQHQP
jgi:N-acetylmuramic acid 6-phosphate etherase